MTTGLTHQSRPAELTAPELKRYIHEHDHREGNPVRNLKGMRKPDLIKVAQEIVDRLKVQHEEQQEAERKQQIADRIEDAGNAIYRAIIEEMADTLEGKRTGHLDEADRIMARATYEEEGTGKARWRVHSLMRDAYYADGHLQKARYLWDVTSMFAQARDAGTKLLTYAEGGAPTDDLELEEYPPTMAALIKNVKWMIKRVTEDVCDRDSYRPNCTCPASNLQNLNEFAARQYIRKLLIAIDNRLEQAARMQTCSGALDEVRRIWWPVR